MKLTQELEMAKKILGNYGHAVITRDENGQVSLSLGEERIIEVIQKEWGTGKERIIFLLEGQNPFQPPCKS